MKSLAILLATSNQGKIKAFQRLVADLPIRVFTPADLNVSLEVDETGATYTENALLKARAYRNASGMSALADDSGLAIDALNGDPGVHSARYGGYTHSPTAQNLLVLERLEGVPEAERGATFTSVLAFCAVDGREWTAEGSIRGRISVEIRGSHGFGYDPIFVVPELEKTYAELSPAEKDPISHRGQALATARYHFENELTLLE